MQPRSRGSLSIRNPIPVNRRIITRPCPIHATLNNRWHPLGLVRLLKCVHLRPAITTNNNNNTTIITTRTTTISHRHRSCHHNNNNNITTTTTSSSSSSTTIIDRRIKIIIDNLEALNYRRQINRRLLCQRGSRLLPMGQTRPIQVRTVCRPSI